MGLIFFPQHLRGLVKVPEEQRKRYAAWRRHEGHLCALSLYFQMLAQLQGVRGFSHSHSLVNSETIVINRSSLVCYCLKTASQSFTGTCCGFLPLTLLWFAGRWVWSSRTHSVPDVNSLTAVTGHTAIPNPPAQRGKKKAVHWMPQRGIGTNWFVSGTALSLDRWIKWNEMKYTNQIKKKKSFQNI